jgi:Uma2 family endonuclease
MGMGTEHTGPWTVADVLALPVDRGSRYELLGESLVVSPAPGLHHQRASFRLHVALDAAARAAGAPVEVLEAVSVVLPSGLAVPDIVVCDAGATAGDAVSIDAEAVALVVELVSPGSRTMDRRVKPLLYAEAGVPALWRLELQPAPVLVTAELEAGRYVERAAALPGTVASVETPFPLRIDPAALTRHTP